jgi:hypothetical protein
MIRPLLALERFLLLDREGTVGHRSDQGSTTQETMDYLEFIARGVLLK